MSVPYLGDLVEDACVRFWWNTNDSDGASITRATDGTIKVRRGSDGTDCTGTSVTDSEDTPDTGIHECIIDTSDNANYTTGDEYVVWLDGAVIDGYVSYSEVSHRFKRAGIHTVTAHAMVGGKPVTQKQKVIVGKSDGGDLGHQ